VSTDRAPKTDAIAIAEEEQRELARRVELPEGRIVEPAVVAGVDVSYAVESQRLTAAAVLVDLRRRTWRRGTTGMVANRPEPMGDEATTPPALS
jgi:hypothetical protein